MSDPCVVVVDDETDILYPCIRWFERQGHIAIGFTDPSLALDYCRIHSESIILVISDIRMPKMDGIELARSIRSFDSGVNIVLASAFDVFASESFYTMAYLNVVELLQKSLSYSVIGRITSKYLSRKAIRPPATPMLAIRSDPS